MTTPWLSACGLAPWRASSGPTVPTSPCPSSPSPASRQGSSGAGNFGRLLSLSQRRKRARSHGQSCHAPTLIGEGEPFPMVAEVLGREAVARHRTEFAGESDDG